MAALDPGALTTLGALVGAVVFSSGFVSDRVHREKGRALDRALRIDERLAEQRSATSDGSSKTRLGAYVLDAQHAALEDVLRDRLSPLLILVNAVLGLVVVALAFAYGAAAGLSFERAADEPGAWALFVFPEAALLVVLVGALDVRNARRQLKASIADTFVGRTALASKAMLSARTERDTRKRMRMVQDARVHARKAFGISGGVLGPAHAMLAYIDLVEAEESRAQQKKLYERAELYLNRAIERGPATTPILATSSLVAEWHGRDKDAVQLWIDAASVMAGRIAPAYEADDLDLISDPLLGVVGADLIVGSARRDAFGWYFNPSPVVLGKALALLPAGDLRAWATALVLARGEIRGGAHTSRDGRQDSAVAIKGLLDRLLQEDAGWASAEHLAVALKKAAPRDSGVSALAAEYLAPHGPIYSRRREYLSEIVDSFSEWTRQMEEFSKRSERQWERYEERERAREKSRQILDKELDALERLWADITEGGTSDTQRAIAMALFAGSRAGLKLQKLERAGWDRVQEEARAGESRLSAEETAGTDKTSFDSSDEDREWEDWLRQQNALKEALEALDKERRRLEEAWANAPHQPQQARSLKKQVKEALIHAKELELTS